MSRARPKQIPSVAARRTLSFVESVDSVGFARGQSRQASRAGGVTKRNHVTTDDAGYLFIDEDVSISTAESARSALQRHNDLPFATDDAGIASVPAGRWALAQKAERKHWMELGIKADDDHNYANAAGFDFYRPLRGMSFRSAIELGCGPFTNLRILGDVCRIHSCDLLDPLIESYLAHPLCRYARTHLTVDRTHLNARVRRFVLRHPGLGLRRLAEHGRIPVGQLLPVPIEEMPIDGAYDLVVMENVLEHCYDARRVFSNLRSVTGAGGILVVHDRYYSAKEVRDRATRVYDAAHPLRVDRRLVDDFLAGAFQPLYRKLVPVKAEFAGVDLSADHFYFVGRRT
jgi:SAM-dependent methyltransferase